MPVFTALATLHPCEWYRDHGSSKPTRTQGHHANPQYLQIELWGEVRDDTIVWSCGTCHDSIHAWIYHLMRGWQAVEPPARLRIEAERVQAWYHEQVAA